MPTHYAIHELDIGRSEPTWAGRGSSYGTEWTGASTAGQPAVDSHTRWLGTVRTETRQPGSAVPARELFEISADVQAWIRVNETVPLRIPYHLSTIQRHYEPDFILIDDHGTYWIVEGKADSEMTSPIVTAKRDAARAWINTVNASGSVHDQWAYLRASESVTANSTTWLALRTGAQTFT